MGIISHDVKESRKLNTPNSTNITSYPAADDQTKITEIGLIIDDRFGVADLVKQGKGDGFPYNLHWAVCNSYDSFETFLKERGVPVYISFDGDLSQSSKKLLKPKDGLDCAKLLVQHCRSLKMPVLPSWSCHAHILTKKSQIELELASYHL